MRAGQVVWIDGTPLLYRGDPNLDWRRGAKLGRLGKEVAALFVAPLWPRFFGKYARQHQTTLRTVAWGAKPAWYRSAKERARVVEALAGISARPLLYWQTMEKGGGDPRLRSLAPVANRFVALVLDLPAGVSIPVSEIQAFRGLRTLTLRGGLLRDADLRALRSLPLEALELRGTKLQGVTPRALAGLTRLERLVMHGATLSGGTLQTLTANTRLVYLDLRGTPLTPGDAAALATLRRLRYLDLRGTGLTDAGLPGIGRLDQLEVLRLDGTQITDNGLAGVSGLTRLRLLSLARTAIGSPGIRNLRALKQLQVLVLPSVPATPQHKRPIIPYPRPPPYPLGKLRRQFPKLEGLGPTPSPRHGYALAYDARRERIVLFGGSGCRMYCADTWEWNGTTWNRRRNARHPRDSWSHPMVYDSKRGRMVLFGGVDETKPGSKGARTASATHQAGTWEWDGQTWTPLHPKTSPSGRSSHAMAYDAHRDRVVLFGGHGHAALDDTWEWDGQTWTQRHPKASPARRSGHAMAYDARRRRVVLFGGTSKGTDKMGDTWEWDGTNWIRRRPTTSPSPRFHHAIAFDARRGRIVLFGGELPRAYKPGGEAKPGDTWEWDGSNWFRRRPPTAPAMRQRTALVYDARRQRIVLFGGKHPTARPFGDTWEWDGTRWTRRR